MKRSTFIALTLSLLAVKGFAQSIPNSSFEDWKSYTYESQKDWYLLGNAETVSDASDSSKAVKLSNTLGDEFNIGFGMVANITFTGGLTGGWDYDEIPLSFEVDTKYDLRAGDTAQVIALFQKSGQSIGAAMTLISGYSNDTFTHFNIPIQWFLPTSPDSVIVIMASRNPDAVSSSGEGYIIFDNLKLSTFGVENRKLRNPSFEQVTTETITYPEFWMTSDIVFHEWFGVDLSAPAVSASTDRKEGGFAMKLTNQAFGDSDLAPGVAITGDTFKGLFSPAFSVDQRWTYISGWWKYSSADDTARIRVILYKDGNIIGGNTDSFLMTRTTWDYFAFPIAYLTSDVPDSATIMVASANVETPLGPNAVLLVDELKLVDAVSVGKILLNGVVIGPVPASDVLYVELEQPLDGQVIVVNTMGQIVFESKINQKQQIEIPMSGLESGVYFLNMNTSNGNRAVKFIKQ